MRNDILERLHVDPGQRTIGQLLQEREAAALEIERLRTDISRLDATRKSYGRESSARIDPTKSRSDEKEQGFLPGSLIRLSEICRFLGLSRGTIYKRLAEGSFPKPHRFGPHTVRWRIEDVEAWRDAHSAARA